MILHENNNNHLSDFIRLNEEWISKYFSIEQPDKDLAKNPSIIIRNGGYIFTLTEEGKVMGACALFNHGNGVLELARMAVLTEQQGKGYGNSLMSSCLSKARELKVKKIYLISNSKLKSAISLYKKFGFITTKRQQHPVYSRANIEMELTIT